MKQLPCSKQCVLGKHFKIVITMTNNCLPSQLESQPLNTVRRRRKRRTTIFLQAVKHGRIHDSSNE